MPSGFELRSRMRMATLAVWLTAAAGVVASLLGGIDALVGLLALCAAAVAGILLKDAHMSLGFAFLLTLAATTWLLFTDTGTLAIVAVAACIVPTGVAPVLARARYSVPRLTAEDRPERVNSADTRLPPGVADAALFDRLTIHEMTRARRYERPLPLLLVGVEGWSTVCADRGRRAAADLLGTLATKVRRLLRDVDAIGVHGEGQLAILLPETPLDGALTVAGRIEQLALDDVGLKVRVGASVFPDDAVTIEGLMQEAEAALDLARLEHVNVVERARVRA